MIGGCVAREEVNACITVLSVMRLDFCPCDADSGGCHSLTIALCPDRIGPPRAVRPMGEAGVVKPNLDVRAVMSPTPF
jgi:hypothetical protein